MTSDATDPPEPTSPPEAEPASPPDPEPAPEPTVPPEPDPEPAPEPTVPKPGPPKPGPPPRSRAPATPIRAPEPATVTEPSADAARFGRVDDDGHVFVRFDDGEREVGTWQAGDPAGALVFFGARFDVTVAEVELLDQRLRSGRVNPDDARATLRRHRAGWLDVRGVGDLADLAARIDRIEARLAEVRAERARARAAALEEGRAAKTAIVTEAEELSRSSDWRAGVNRFRQLLDAWKAQPRLDRSTDDELWHRFSAARTAYTRRRKAHFGEISDRQQSAQATKERLAAQAEELATSTEWGPTAAKLRSLMEEWRGAGGAAKDVDDALWARFRAASDAFFAARSAHFGAQDAEFAANLTAKQALLTEAEALLPVRDGGRALRDLQDRWSAVGKVPRDSMRSVEGRMRAVEDAVNAAESTRWQATNPEMLARAESTTTALRASVEKLTAELRAAQDRGDERAAAAARESLTARSAWLAEAERALADFSG